MPRKNGETSRRGCGFEKLAAIHRICHLSASHRIGVAKAVRGHPNPTQSCNSRNFERDFHDPIPDDQEYNPDRWSAQLSPGFIELHPEQYNSVEPAPKEEIPVKLHTS
jgi:hypothetical protein